MKAFDRIFVAVVAAVIVLLAVANGLLFAQPADIGRHYLVEISRLTRLIEAEGLECVDLTSCAYVTAVKPFGENFYVSYSDYAIREIGGELYRFDYTVGTDAEKGKHILTVNLILGIIHAKADEIERYVTQIITASREDFLSLDVNMGEFYLSTLVESIKCYYSEKLALIKTDFSVGEYTDCLLNGDLDRSIEVIQNMMENAIKYDYLFLKIPQIKTIPAGMAFLFLEGGRHRGRMWGG